jgi:hypothetical protein
VTIIVPFVAGGNTDMMARSPRNGCQQNSGSLSLSRSRWRRRCHRRGAGGASAPDGYTIPSLSRSRSWCWRRRYRKSATIPQGSDPITEFGTGPQILGVKATCRSTRCRNSSSRKRARAS